MGWTDFRFDELDWGKTRIRVYLDYIRQSHVAKDPKTYPELAVSKEAVPCISEKSHVKKPNLPYITQI